MRKLIFSINLLSTAAVLACFTLATTPVVAQDAENGEGETFEANSIEVFLGGTFDDGDSEASYGVSYERRLNESIGIGGMVEYTIGREWVFAAPFTIHITEPLIQFLIVGACIYPTIGVQYCANQTRYGARTPGESTGKSFMFLLTNNAFSRFALAQMIASGSRILDRRRMVTAISAISASMLTWVKRERNDRIACCSSSFTPTMTSIQVIALIRSVS
jgi:hypothetical protein